MSHIAFTRHALAAAAMVVSAGLTTAGAQRPSPAPEGVIDTIVRFAGTDGTPLEAKLSLPAGAPSPVPVVFYLHGAGPRNFDHPVRFRASDGTIQQTRYYDYYARELARHGLGFFRMSKRGCTVGDDGRSAVDRAVFSQATSTVMLQDYAAALDVLRRRADVDGQRIVLLGSSEGTRLAPQLARRSPDGVAGLVLMSHQPDNLRNTVVWQNSAGAWRAVSSMIPAAADDALTRAEYDEAVRHDASLTTRLPFPAVDTDRNGVATSAELAALIRPRLDAILKAVEDRNDDFIWQSLLNLTSAYLLDGWDADPTQTFLLPLAMPIGIFHGELDGTTRVEGARETEAAFRAAGKSNLTVRTYPGLDHDLGWTPPAADRGPEPFQDAFRFAAELVRPRKSAMVRSSTSGWSNMMNRRD